MRVYNFAAGPAMMPLSVLQQMQGELLDYEGTGMSVMEMSHRSATYDKVIRGAEETLRRIMNIPENYAVLFLQGGASTQFSMVPMNLAKRGQKTSYAVTGLFAGRAFEEAKRWGDAKCIFDGKENGFHSLPTITPDMLDEDSAYLHITGNNTVYGTTYNTLPDTGKVPLVCDLSSVILGKEFDVSKFALLYAGAQKNMGPSGLTVVIVRKDFIREDLDPIVPTMLRYSVAEKHGSMYNTPPTFAIYAAGLVFRWVEEQGGVKALEKRNTEKANLLYDYIDKSSLFTCPTEKKDRSIMNVPFLLPTQEMTDAFLSFAKEKGLVSLKGHRAAGGCRASIYNAMPIEGVQALVDCMTQFEKEHR